jgi:hypothetical protein
MMRSWLSSLASGAAGALALTAIHELGRRQVSYAPRLDVLGMRALRRFTPALRHEAPRSGRLRRWALAGDLIANTMYYAAVPARSRTRTWTRAAALGLSAGAGEPPHSERLANQAMTVAWYVAGALVSAAAANFIASRRQRYAAS